LNTINNLTNINIANLLISLGTLGAVFVSYMTLGEIRKERELSMLPDVFISSINQVNIKFDEEYLDCPYLHNSTILNIENQNLSLPIRNLGFGPAKNLNFKWNINYNDLNREFKNRFGENNTMQLLTEKYDNFEESLIICKRDTIFMATFLEQPVHFLAPSLTKNISNELNIPDDVVTFSLYNRLMYSNRLGKTQKVINLPFELDVSYKNLIGKEYIKRFNIELSGFILDSIWHCGIKIEEKTVTNNR